MILEKNMRFVKIIITFMVERELLLQNDRGESGYDDELIKEFKINLGAPRLFKIPGVPFIRVPELPHVFFCRVIVLISNKYPPIPPLISDHRFIINNAMVMLAHGWVNNNNNWEFLHTGKPVWETVLAYEEVANRHNWPPIDVVLACNQNESSSGKVTLGPPLKVKKIGGSYYIVEKHPHIYPTSNVTLHNSSLVDGKSPWFL